MSDSIKKYEEDIVFGKKQQEKLLVEMMQADEKDGLYDTPKHYDNSKGSIYKFAEDQKLNPWEYEVVKRIVRCRKKGEWISDIEKTINVLKLYQKEQGHLYEGQVEKPNKQ